MVIRWGRLQPAIWATVILLVSITAADAEGDKASKPSEFILLAQIALLIAVGRGLGELMQRIGQPSVIGELLGGLLLGPSLFGWLWPSAHSVIFPTSGEQKALIDGIAQFGILLLLLLTGMDTDLKLVRKVGRAATTISVAGIAVPFVCGFVLGEFLPDGLLPHPEARLIASLFLGTALSISSVKIVAVVVREMNFMRRNVGQIIVASAIIDDTLGWIIIAVIFSLASRGSLDLLSVAQALFGTLAFLAVSFTIGRRLVFRLIRWANDHLVSSAAVITVILMLMCGMAMITHLIGVHTVLGAFIAGVLVGESPILTRRIDERLRGLISSLFMPVFFGLAGLSADLTVLKDPSVLGLTAALVLIASIGKFGGAFVGGALGGLTRPESYALASGMNARGSTEVIIATIGLSMGMLSQTMYSMIVTMAILTTMAMPPMLRSALARLPLGKDEKERLEREEYEQRGFVANLERLLLAVDESSNATFAAHLAGQLAGGRGLPITVLHVGANAKLQEQNRADAESPEAAVINAAKASAEADADGGGGNVDVISRAREETVAEAIAEEARKGFDLLVVGMDAVAGPDGGFDRRIDDLTSGFDGPLAIAAAKGVHEKEPTANARKILVPVSGSNVSRRGAEVAIALARLSSEPLQVVYVSTTRDKGARRTSPSMSLAHEEAILKDIAATAARYDINVTTRLRANTAPEVAILQEIASSRADLVVIGVDRIQGDSLNFGSIAAAVLGKSKASVLLVSDGDVRPKTWDPKT
ncbi:MULTISPECIES: cation:proton antiporter domain-containing protein [Bradyrhizobium]|nr:MULTISPECIES: cation:proton antiporter [Bradyrhizobium]MCS3450265.1 Kef-type K+ transport system membrane component KefB/nucleotide-binding universal stress UspA family protein [Bradyrhizobium elkanii]MCS3558590.1 Kef-type K+ transport system membrane component KefB/nucleotide-binding universal stress UspA family protein [Bradyrhizobium elkanii]MCW2151563.1 Kef-type K+ transport system membrane component KefB/nucleotide-binding universal stress UspA family protein [Bradyrhizobium elkanii]MCW